MESIEEVTTLADLGKVPDQMGARIAIARENAGMSLGQLAAHLGVTPAAVKAWERDARAPRANRLQMMAGILGVSLAWLLEGREDARMERGGTPTLDELRQQLESARALLGEGMNQLDGALAGLEALAADDAVDATDSED